MHEHQTKFEVFLELTNMLNCIGSVPIFYGSLALSQLLKESIEVDDIDILIELDYSKPIGLEFVQMQLDLQDLLNSKVDLVSTKGLSKHIQPYIEKEKILIYAR